MKIIDTLLVKKALPPAITNRAQWNTYQRNTLNALRRLTFQYIPEKTAPAMIEFRNDGQENAWGSSLSSYIFKSADEINLRARVIRPLNMSRSPILAFALSEDAHSGHFGIGRPPVSNGVGTACIEVRNTASSSVGPGYLWTLRRSYPLLGQTLPERQVQDLLTGVEIIRQQSFAGDIALYGEGRTAVLALYAAVLDPGITEVALSNLPASHEEPETPEFPGILKIGDLPQNLALLWPRPITFIGKKPPAYQWTENLYKKLGKGNLIRHFRSVHDWKPLGQ